MQMLKGRFSHRYTIVQLRLTGPLLQLSKTVAGEVCVVFRDGMQSVNVV